MQGMRTPAWRTNSCTSCFAEFDTKIEAASADYQELTQLLGEKEEAEMLLLDLMEQWEAAQEG